MWAAAVLRNYVAPVEWGERESRASLISGPRPCWSGMVSTCQRPLKTDCKVPDKCATNADQVNPTDRVEPGSERSGDPRCFLRLGAAHKRTRNGKMVQTLRVSDQLG